MSALKKPDHFAEVEAINLLREVATVKGRTFVGAERERIDEVAALVTSIRSSGLPAELYFSSILSQQELIPHSPYDKTAFGVTCLNGGDKLYEILKRDYPLSGAHRSADQYALGHAKTAHPWLTQEWVSEARRLHPPFDPMFKDAQQVDALVRKATDLYLAHSGAKPLSADGINQIQREIGKALGTVCRCNSNSDRKHRWAVGTDSAKALESFFSAALTPGVRSSSIGTISSTSESILRHVMKQPASVSSSELKRQLAANLAAGNDTTDKATRIKDRSKDLGR